jgi:PPOX class probable F420-dependent enzyme
VSRRAEIVMSDAESGAFLAAGRTIVCASIGRDGRPHLMPLWYVLRDAQVWAWTYAKSQKVVNLRRDPRCTLELDAGEQYHELRGVMLECDALIHGGLDVVARLGTEITARYAGGDVTPELAAAVRAQAGKRVALQFVERRRRSWDHSKLGGTH